MTRPEPLLLDPPPRYLAGIEDKYLRPKARIRGVIHDYDPERLVVCLRDYGILARPSLADVEAERVRRGMRRGEIDWHGVGPRARQVLPLGPVPARPKAVRRGGRRASTTSGSSRPLAA